MRTIDHRGFTPIPEALYTITLNASLSSDLVWEMETGEQNILWHLKLDIQNLSPGSLASCRRAAEVFNQTIWEKYHAQSIGVILYQGDLPPFPLDDFADFLHLVAAELSEEIHSFALFDCGGNPLLFSKEIFPHIHLGFRSGLIGAIEWGETLIPKTYEGRTGVVLPLREKGFSHAEVDSCLASLEEGTFRLINEPYLTEEWDGLDQIIIFPHLISSWGMRMVQGFKAAGGEVIEFGVEGFEPPAFCSQSRRASQAALYPEKEPSS